MGDVLYEGQVEKYAMGRKTGVSAKNWKTRHMKLTRSTLSYAEKPNAQPKLEVPVNAVSLLFTNPTKDDHPEVSSGHYLMMRLFENGVFNLLVKLTDETEKRKWVAAFAEAMSKNKGYQQV